MVICKSHAGAQLAGKALISPDQLRAQLKGLAEQRILVVLVVDILDCSGSFLTRVRDLVGRNPVLLVGTKVSLPNLGHMAVMRNMHNVRL